MTSRATPPRWAKRLATRLLPRRDREFLAADLDDGFADQRARGRPATSWYLLQAAHAAWTRRRRTSIVDRTGGPMFTSLIADVRTAWRGCRTQRGITTAVILSLGLGIGSASAMFTVVRAVLIAPLPYRQPDRLVTVWDKWTGFDRTWLASKDALDFKASHAVEDIAVWSRTYVTLTGMGDAIRLSAGAVTPSTFAVLGASPLYGRTFTDAEALAASNLPGAVFAVLSYNLWLGTFGGDPAIVGRTVQLNDHQVTILGVMPPHFQLPNDFTDDAAEPTVLWVPYYDDPATATNQNHGLYAAARLAPGATLGQFNQDLARIAGDLTRAGIHPAEQHFTAFALAIDDDVLGGVRPSLRVLFGAVTFLVLIACANAAALLIARADSRRREWTTRVALGASRGRLVRLQLVEGLLLALAGGGLGIGLALFAKRALGAIGPTAVPRAGDIAVDWRVIAFMVAVSAASAVLCSLAPAVHAIRFRVVDGLKDGTSTSSVGRGRMRLRALLVVSQLSLGLLLLAGAGLMARTLWTMRQIDLGFRPDHVLTARLSLPRTRYSKPELVDAYTDALLGRLRQLPGVTAAGFVRSLPLASTIGDWDLTVEGYTPPSGETAKGDWQVATPGALEALGERRVRGRFFTPADTAAATPVALVNETMARTYWAGLDPIGRRVKCGAPTSPWVTVVGIVGDVRHNGITSTPKTKFYLPYTQYALITGVGEGPVSGGTVVLRTTGDPMAEAAPLRAAAAATDPTVPVAAIRPMTTVVDTALTAPRLTSQVMGSFAVVALMLSTIGLFGLLVYLVTQRTQEIGIRMAIGATTPKVVAYVFAEGMRVALAGIAVGLTLSALSVRALSSLLYGVKPWDPITWAVAPLVLILTASVACAIPALRAARINPLKALRHG